MITVKITKTYKGQGHETESFNMKVDDIEEAIKRCRYDLLNLIGITSMVIECKDPKEKITIAR